MTNIIQVLEKNLKKKNSLNECLNVNGDSGQTRRWRCCICQLTPPVQCAQYFSNVSRCQNSVMCSCGCIMSELSELERGQIVRARMWAASVTKVVEVSHVSKGAISKIYTAYKNIGKTTSTKTQR